MKEKILFVTYCIHGGGAEKQMRYLLRSIDRTKFEPHLALYHLTGNESAAVPEGIPVYHIGTWLKPATFFSVLNLVRLIRKIRPGLMVSFLWTMNLISIIAAIIAKVPIIVSERTHLPSDIPRNPLPVLKKAAVKLLYPKARTIVAVSENAKLGLTEALGIPGKNIIVIRSGIDLNEVSEKSAKYTVEESGFILSCGSLKDIKNYDLLIESASLIPGSKLIILGTGPYRKRLVLKAEKLGVTLILPGFVENPYPYFKKASVFALTSLYEGFPNVVLEAMACGTPVVAVNCPGGISEIVEDGRTGFLVEQGNARALAAALEKVLKDPGLRGVLSSNSLEKVRKEFNLNKMADSYREVFMQRR